MASAHNLSFSNFKFAISLACLAHLCSSSPIWSLFLDSKASLEAILSWYLASSFSDAVISASKSSSCFCSRALSFALPSLSDATWPCSSPSSCCCFRLASLYFSSRGEKSWAVAATPADSDRAPSWLGDISPSVVYTFCFLAWPCLFTIGGPLLGVVNVLVSPSK